MHFIGDYMEELLISHFTIVYLVSLLFPKEYSLLKTKDTLNIIQVTKNSLNR